MEQWKRKMKERRGGGNETEQSFAISFCTYIHRSIYLSFRSYIFNKKLYRIYNRHCLLHFLYPNFYCTFPHGESLFCSSSFSLLFLILPPLSFFSLWCKFSVFSYRKWSTREKRERKLCTIEHSVRWCRRIPFRDRFLDKRKFSKHRDIFFYRGSAIRFVRKIEFVSLINWLTLLNLFIY